MAYLTKLNNRDISTLVYNYKLIDYIKYTPIYEGIQNSNYILITKNKKYILTIFEDQYVIKNLKQYFKLMTFLKEKNFSCPSPIKDIKNNSINSIYGKPYALVNFLDGKYLQKHALVHCSQLGRYIANLHLITSKYPINIKRRFNKNFYINTIEDNHSQINQYGNNLINLFNNEISELNNINIPMGIIHGDLFPDNVLFHKGKIIGFIDFYFSSTDYLITDIAIVIISWCFYSKGNNNIDINNAKVNEIIKSYNLVRKISFHELSALNTICKIYCIRFFLTRLLDYKLKNDSQKVLTKNPKEYINKLLFFVNNNIKFEKILFNE